MNSPLVSVIIPTFNRPALLKVAVASVEAQTFRNYEILVINDSGPAVEVPPSVRYFARSEHGGVGAARNTGLQNALGKYIAYLDDDDRYLPNHLETLIPKLEDGSADLVYGDNDAVTGTGDGVETGRQPHPNPNFDPARILLENYIPSICVVHRRECLERCGMFDESLTALEDWELWFRFAQEFRFLHVPIVTCEVWRYTDRPSVTALHGTGFAWAALNCLYKLAAALPNREDLLALYRLRAEEALAHLKLGILQTWHEGKASLEPIFSFQPPARVFERLGELEKLYGTNLSQFQELRGLLLAHQGKFAPAAELLRQSLETDASNQSAATLLGILEQAMTKNS